MEEMEVNHVDDIHEKLTDMVGDRVKVKANMGRTRVVERMGTIKSVHPAVFIVEVDERRGRKSRQSCQYIDVLTGQVELFAPESGAPDESGKLAALPPEVLSRLILPLGDFAPEDVAEMAEDFKL